VFVGVIVFMACLYWALSMILEGSVTERFGKDKTWMISSFFFDEHFHHDKHCAKVRRSHAREHKLIEVDLCFRR
jgi:hypothetical protein